MDVTQEDLDNLATEVGDVKTALDAGMATVQTELDALETQIQEGKPSNELDLTGLKSAVADLGSDVTKVGELKPTPSNPTPSGAAPTNADGTAAENETDPQKAAEAAKGE